MDLSIFNANTLPAHLQAVKAAAPAINLGGSTDTRNRIKMKNGRFIIQIAGAQEKVLDILRLPVIIIGAHDYVSRIWYAGKWQQGVAARPGCFSSDGVTPNATSPQAQAARCDLCPQNQKGSSDTGGKACAFFKRLVVLIAGKSTPFMLDVKSMSIFGTGDTANAKYGLTEYSKILAGKGINPSMVITELTFDANASVPKIFFTPTGFIDEGMAVQVQTALANKELMDEYRSVDLTTLGDEPGTPLVNAGPTPSNIQRAANPPGQQPAQQAAPVQAAPVAAQQAAPQPATQAAPAVRKFGVSATDAPVEAAQVPIQPTAVQASVAQNADIDKLLNDIDFG